MQSTSLAAILVVIAVLATTPSAVAQTRPSAQTKTTVAPAAARPDSQGAPPELVIAVAKGRDKIEVRRVVTRIAAEVSEFKTSTGETVSQTQMRRVPETHSSVIDLSMFTVRRVDGRPVSKKELSDRLLKPTPILVMDPGTKYDDRFLKLCKPDALIFIEKEARRINPSASPEDGPTSTLSPLAPTVVSPAVSPPAAPDAPSATPTSRSPQRK